MRNVERNHYRGFPSRKPVWTIGAFFGALVVFALAMAWQYKFDWTWLQRWYLSEYVFGDYRTYFGNARPGKWLRPDATQYALAYRVEKKSRRLATNADLFDPTLDGVKVKIEAVWVKNVQLHRFRAWAKDAIYGGRAPWELLAQEWKVGAGFFVLGLFYAVPKDRRRARERRYGRRLRGPEYLTQEEFRSRLNADGIFLFGPSRGRLAKLWWRLTGWLTGRSYMPLVQIPRAKEAKHILVMGDTGSGKGVTVQQILRQIRDRGEHAIVYDPGLEYLPRFYDPNQDVILNPLDVRMPFWNPGDEVRSSAEAVTLAHSLFPDKVGYHNEYFLEASREVMAELLSLRPTVEQLVEWMCNPIEIDRRLKGTHLASMIEPTAPQQRAGVISSFNMIGRALKHLPKEGEGNGRWTSADWAANPRGWIFITSKHDTRDAVRPLISFFLDMLVLRLMTEGHREKPTWFVLDEIATLQRLPQLHTALTENRKSGNPVVLAFQGRSQMEQRYGGDAESMLSQPATKVFLATTEPDAAEWISRAIGEREIERVHESRSDGRFPTNDRHTKSDAIEIRQEMLVLASQVAGLPELRGYIKHGNYVSDLLLQPLDLPERHPKFIERPSLEAPRVEAAHVEPLRVEPLRVEPLRVETSRQTKTQDDAKRSSPAPADEESRPRLKRAVGQTPDFD